MLFKKEIVCTFCQPILASIDNCICIFIAQLYRMANESNLIIYTFYQPFLARVDNCIWIFIALLYRIANESNCMCIILTISCKG